MGAMSSATGMPAETIAASWTNGWRWCFACCRQAPARRAHMVQIIAALATETEQLEAAVRQQAELGECDARKAVPTKSTGQWLSLIMFAALDAAVAGQDEARHIRQWSVNLQELLGNLQEWRQCFR